MLSRTFRRNIPKFCALFVLGSLVFLLLVRSDAGRTSDEANPGGDYTDKMRKEAMLDNRHRIAQVDRVCKKYKLGIYKTPGTDVVFKEPPVPQYGVFYIDSHHNISYCPVYKSGSTTWLYNLCLLNGVKEEELLTGREQISVIARRVVPQIDYPEAEYLLKKSAKILVVRHPFERLLSAYRDKLENSVAGREHGSLHFYKKYGESIVRKFRNKNNPTPSSKQVIRKPNQPGPAGIEPTFREFVDYLIATDLASYADDHWMPYYLYCTPCLIDYDVIAKVETLWRDQAYAISQLGLTDKIRPRWRHGSSSGDSAAEVYFSQLTREHVRKLHEKFRLDFELFGYSAERYYAYAQA